MVKTADAADATAHFDARAIQRALNAGGSRLAEDGIIGPATRAAIYAAVQSAVGGAAASWPADRLRIAFEQIMLRDARLYSGNIDGVVGTVMRAALVEKSLQSIVSRALPPWLIVARSYIGTHEGVGASDNPRVVEMFALAGHPEVRRDSVAWCAAFVGACLARAGQQGTGSLWALDYARWGQSLLSPIVGAVATKKRVGGGHVFFVADFDATTIWGLGGNQSDQVSIVRFPRSVINSYAWPRGVAKPRDSRAGAFRVGAVEVGSEA